jgi:Fe-S-cluster containining protein
MSAKKLIAEYVEGKDPNHVPAEVNRSICDNCTICCEHVSLQIDTPETEEDYQDIIWYVMHENVFVMIDNEGDWLIEFKTKCKALDEKGLCQIHSNRPKICREYSQDTCEMHGDGESHKFFFKNRDEVIRWVQENTDFKNFGE